MKKPFWHNGLLAFAAVVFTCLLLHGAPRLVAGNEEPIPPLLPSESWFTASIRRAPQSEGERTDIKKADANRTFAAFDAGSCIVMGITPKVVTDSNGNILRDVSYMRAVYQSFSLGDGFV